MIARREPSVNKTPPKPSVVSHFYIGTFESSTSTFALLRSEQFLLPLFDDRKPGRLEVQIPFNEQPQRSSDSFQVLQREVSHLWIMTDHEAEE